MRALLTSDQPKYTPNGPSGKVNVSIQPISGKLLRPYKSECPSKMIFTPTSFQANYTIAIFDIKKKKTLKLINTKKMRKYKSSLFKKKQSEYILLNYTKLHYLSLVYCKDEDNTLEVGSFCFTPFTALTLFSISFTHPCKRSIHAMMSDVSWFPQYNRKLDISIKKVK